MIFFAGVSLTLSGTVSLLQNLPGDFSWRHPARALQDDYQQNWRFRGYISDRLEAFLAMATDSFSGHYYGYYGGGDYFAPGVYVEQATEGTASFVPDIPWELQEIYEETQLQPDPYEWIFNPDTERWEPEMEFLTEEQRREQYRKAARQYHDSIKQDENLLYSISYDGKVLYANSELLPQEDKLTPPEGYNFLLQYAEGKVRIIKDGIELDVYGDGYYRNDSAWYVPGYRNFPADEDMKKAVIYMAVAREPVLYSESSYGRGGYRQMDNSLYWMQYNTRENRRAMIRNIICLGTGLALLLASFLCRKSRQEANAGIARFTGKIWFEAKILMGLLILYPLFLGCVMWLSQNYGDSISEVIYQAEAESYGYALSYVGLSLGQAVFHLPVLVWILLFWLLYLAFNDLRYNRKVWKHGLVAKLCRTFSVRDLKQPLPVRTAHRNGAAFAAAAVYGLLMLAGGIMGFTGGRDAKGGVWGLGSLFFLIMVGFLVLQYRIGVKNMETARDMEALTKRIRDIRNGNYAGNGDGSQCALLSGHDLEDAMAELEDIRHGMAIAVDEQMKSERMKVELIANVSHDIKTPLTSIISYVQFLKEEKELPEHVRDYVKILDEKSQRLKNMVQDVFAVSKAASGELPMHMEELDFCKLLRQTLADMEEQITGSKVTFRTELPETPVMIMADGQRMYRVFQNLFQNAIQYSLEGSRVFVTLQTDGQLAVASVKNTSRQELEKDKDFTERFARGDLSRTDGGSGLGLSIAQSFTEACGGSFSWETNADLFVVTVSFRILEYRT
ncbi:MAG: HAMP domain-containing histidine kinase [Lachnospiraceae bacterium]|nr:HAMP domain-containing histidine kinase [Lachnospiraceae bacterium]